MFSQKGRYMNRIPPTKDALLHHTMRAVFQASFIWNQMTTPILELPCPSSWGWTHDDISSVSWSPKWMGLSPVKETLSELLKCGCKKGCGGHCKCRRAQLPCTSLCMCNGGCNQYQYKFKKGMFHYYDNMFTKTVIVAYFVMFCDKKNILCFGTCNVMFLIIF